MQRLIGVFIVVMLVLWGRVFAQELTPPPGQDVDLSGYVTVIVSPTEGNLITQTAGGGIQDGGVSLSDYPKVATQTATCESSGDGSAGALTLTPTASKGIVHIALTVEDPQGCNVTMGEVGAVANTEVVITNVSAAYTATFTTAAGTLTMTQGTFTMAATESLHLLYLGSRWLEVGRSTATWSGLTIGGFTANKGLKTDASGNVVVTTLSDTNLEDVAVKGAANAFTGAMTFSGSGSITTGDAVLTATTPKIVTGIKDVNGNTIIGFSPTGSAVNYVQITNNIADDPASVVVSGVGSSTNIDLWLSAKGAGGIVLWTNEEYLKLNYTSSTATLSSPSGMTDLSLGSLNLTTTGGITGGSLTASDVANDNYVKITNNSGGRAPTASVYELYPDAGIWKATENGVEFTIQKAGACTALTPGAAVTLTVASTNCYTDTVTDNEDQTITFSGAGYAGQEVTIIFTTAGEADEVITFHATLVSSTGTLTLGTDAGKFYTIRFISDGSHWYEVSRTAVQT